MDEQATPTPEPQADQGQPPLRRRLGRGLNALLGGGEDEAPRPAAATGNPDLDPNLISIELIERNPYQPRKEFDKETLAELTDSVRQHGVLQPLLVRPHNGRYQLVAGERRLRAARECGLEHVPCRVMELDDQHLCEAAIEENLKRTDLNALEKAQAFREYLDRFGSTMEQLAGRLSINRSTLSNFLRLLDLPDAVKKALSADKITNGHARALLSLPEAEQVALCKRIQSEHLSVRQTENLVREQTKGTPTEDGPATIPMDPSAKPANPFLTSHVLSLQEQLCGLLQAKVEIKLKSKEAGRIVIAFDSNDQFDHIVRHLRRSEAA